MSSSPDELSSISINGSHRSTPDFTTMPSHVNVRNPMGRMNPPYPRPTVSMDPRPVVIPILSSVIGFPILVFALICALRHRAIKLRRRDQLKKIQAGVRSVTLDLPPRDKMSFFSGGSSPEISMRDVPDYGMDSSISASGRRGPSGNNHRVKFITPPDSPRRVGVSVDVVLHTLATGVAAAGLNGGAAWQFRTDTESGPATSGHNGEGESDSQTEDSR